MLKRILCVLAALLLIVPAALAEEGKPLYAVKDENGCGGTSTARGIWSFRACTPGPRISGAITPWRG